MLVFISIVAVVFLWVFVDKCIQANLKKNQQKNKLKLARDSVIGILDLLTKYQENQDEKTDEENKHLINAVKAKIGEVFPEEQEDEEEKNEPEERFVILKNINK